jgi:hypothetical protein
LNNNPLNFDQTTGAFRTTVSLRPGENELTILALYRDFSFAQRRIPVTVDNGMETIRGVGRQYAVIIANDNYAGTGYPNLVTPKSDALSLASVLEKRLGFHTKARSNDGATRNLVLLNAGRNQIMETLDSLKAYLTPDDSLLVFYAGHGEYIEKINHAYWIPVDARKDAYYTWISADDITSMVAMLPARHILVVADSCYSGALNRGGEAAGRQGNDDRVRYIENMFRRPSRVLLSSGGTEPVADGGGDGHSVFARALLTGLSEEEDPVFTAEELYQRHIKARVVGQSSQSPQYQPLPKSGHEGGDFVFRKQVTESGKP